jgi:hypothetical protein
MHNAEIEKYQQMLGFISSGISVAEKLGGEAGSNNQPPKVQLIYNNVEYKWQMIINNPPSITRH